LRLVFVRLCQGGQFTRHRDPTILDTSSRPSARRTRATWKNVDLEERRTGRTSNNDPGRPPRPAPRADTVARTPEDPAREALARPVLRSDTRHRRTASVPGPAQRYPDENRGVRILAVVFGSPRCRRSCAVTGGRGRRAERRADHGAGGAADVPEMPRRALDANAGLVRSCSRVMPLGASELVAECGLDVAAEELRASPRRTARAKMICRSERACPLRGSRIRSRGMTSGFRLRPRTG
jgi:hypothetical protein